jgi:hypothetical protein
VKRALLALALVCACTLRAPRNNAASCGADSTCHPTPIALTSVSAQVQPGSDSSFGLVQSGNVNLGASVEQDFTLSPTVLATGQVIQLQNAGGAAPVGQATVIFTDHLRAIPGQVQQITARSDVNGSFSARLPAGFLWDVLVQPPPPLPPYRLPLPFSTSTAVPLLTLPSPASLVTVQGTVTAPSADLSGASVAAVDATGDALSTSATVDADGGYSLVLPPGTNSYFLEVGAPGPPADGGVAAADGGVANAELATLPSYDKLPGVANVVLSLPPVANLNGTVVDSAGRTLAGVPVFARSTTDESWTLARSTVTDASGAFSLQVRAGIYVVEAVPPAGTTDPAISPMQDVTVPVAGATIRLVCSPKLIRTLLILMPNGRPAGANFQITATRQTDPLLVSRVATALATSLNGESLITGDPGTYNVLVTAPAGTGLPRRYTQLVLDPADPPTDVGVIQLDAALTVVGTVHGTPEGGKDGPVSGAMVSFFGLELGGDSLLLGSTSTDSLGHYSVVLPDVAGP